MLTEYNYQTGHNRSIKYIVIHYVGATGGSKANAVYFGSKNVGASAHYFVGHAGEDIYQVVADEDIAWHCGTTGHILLWMPQCQQHRRRTLLLAESGRDMAI